MHGSMTIKIIKYSLKLPNVFQSGHSTRPGQVCMAHRAAAAWLTQLAHVSLHRPSWELHSVRTEEHNGQDSLCSQLQTLCARSSPGCGEESAQLPCVQAEQMSYQAIVPLHDPSPSGEGTTHPSVSPGHFHLEHRAPSHTYTLHTAK